MCECAHARVPVKAPKVSAFVFVCVVVGVGGVGRGRGREKIKHDNGSIRMKLMQRGGQTRV